MRAGFALAGLAQQVLALNTGSGVFGRFAQTLGLFGETFLCLMRRLTDPMLRIPS